MLKFIRILQQTLPGFILGISLLTSSGSSADNILNFSRSLGMPYTNGDSGHEDRLVKEIFGSLGYQVRIHYLPPERALKNLNDGLDDGALGRVKGISKVYPNIIEIPENAYDRSFVVFTRDHQFTPSDWDSLKPYNVGIIRGWKILEDKFKDLETLTIVNHEDQLFKMLDMGRVDVIIYFRWGGLHKIRRLSLENISILEPPLATIPHAFLLNKKHADLAEAAAEKLRIMKQDGSYQQIFDETLGTLELF